MTEQMREIVMKQLRLLSGTIIYLDSKELATASAWLSQAINSLPIEYLSREE